MRVYLEAKHCSWLCALAEGKRAELHARVERYTRNGGVSEQCLETATLELGVASRSVVRLQQALHRVKKYRRTKKR